MKKNILIALAFIASVTFVPFIAHAADTEPGFTPLFDGKTFTGWKPSVENSNTWKLEDGAIVARGERSHLYYVGDSKPFKNFELKVDVMTQTNSNGGIYLSVGAVIIIILLLILLL